MDKTIEERIKAIHPPKWGNGRVEIGVPDLILYKRYTPVQMFVITMGGIVLAEVIAMIVISYFNYLPYYQQVIMDATIMVTIIFPLIYFFSFEPLLKQMLEHNRTHRITRVRLRLMQYAASHSLDDLLQYILDEIETHSGSSIGFFHFLEADQKTLWLQAWSSHTLQDMCKAEGKGSHYNVDQAGVWVDCVKERKPVVHNDYSTLAHRKGLPKGHAPIIRELSIPIIRADRILAVLGQGNKPTPYTEEDVDLVSTLADFAWDVVEAKRSELALRKSEEKFRTLVEWTNDWEKWVNPQGEIVYISPSCERITGYAAQEFIQNPELLKMIVHPDDQQAYIEHQDHVHDSSTGPMTIEYRILSRTGGQRWIEHMCRPLFGTDGEYLGRRISNRDVTERKQAEDEIREHNHREAVLANTIHTIQTDIARDLHDTLGQNIGFLRMNLEHACETHMRGETIPHIQMQSMIRAADESYELIRAMLT
ncbi:MAG TPA: GAF domain-containing protein, partial [Anaerolineales bacterium]